jgi:zinc D-Ala-D-Ala dipeptidase
MQLVMDYPVRECGEQLVPLPDAFSAANLDVEFSGTPIVDDLPRIFEVREGLLAPLLAVARDMNERGWVLKIEDGFRTAEMQRKLARKASIFDAILEKVAWETEADAPDPDLVFRRVSVLVAVVPKVAGHMAGCAVDISVLDRDTRAALDRGGPYLEMSELTPMFCPFVSPEALHTRAEITFLMESHGFMGYPFEFWHYSMGDIFAEQLRFTGKPARYAAVHRDPSTRAIQPVPDLMAQLHRDQEIREEIAAAMTRNRARRVR